MNPQAQKLRKAFLLTMLSLATAPFCLSKEKTLQSNSPFLPPNYGKNQAPSPTVNKAPPGQIARTLELRGIMRMKGAYSLNFFDKNGNKSFWVKEETTHIDGYRIGPYNADNKSVQVTKGRSTEWVSLVSTSHKPQAVNASVNVAKPLPATKPPALTQPTQNQKKTTRSVPRRRVILPNKK